MLFVRASSEVEGRQAVPALQEVVRVIEQGWSITAAAAAAETSPRTCGKWVSRFRSAIHALACRALGLRHLRTRAYRPQTNGKAERFIRTMLAGWAHGAIYGSSRERTAALDWLYRYNHHRDTKPSAANRPSHD